MSGLECEHDWVVMESGPTRTVEGMRQCRKCGDVATIPGAPRVLYAAQVWMPTTATEILAGRLPGMLALDGVRAENEMRMAELRDVARGGLSGRALSGGFRHTTGMVNGLDEARDLIYHAYPVVAHRD